MCEILKKFKNGRMITTELEWMHSVSSLWRESERVLAFLDPDWPQVTETLGRKATAKGAFKGWS